MLPTAMLLTRVRPPGSARPARSRFTRGWVTAEWLNTVALGGTMCVCIAGEAAATPGTIVYANRLGHVAARLNDGRLVKFIDGVRLRGNRECLAPPVGT